MTLEELIAEQQARQVAEILDLLRVTGLPTHPTTTQAQTTTKETTMAKKMKFNITGRITEHYTLRVEADSESQAREYMERLRTRDVRDEDEYVVTDLNHDITCVEAASRSFSVEGTIEVPFSIVVQATDADEAMEKVAEMTMGEIRQKGELLTEEICANTAEPC